MSLNPVGTMLVVPPMNFLLLGVVGTLLVRRWPRAGLAMIGAGLFVLLVLAMPVTAGTLIGSLEAGLPLSPNKDPPGAIVILAGDVVSVAGPPGTTDVGQLTLERLRAGAALYRRTRLPILVSGGVPPQGGLAIADLMAKSLTDDFGVPVRWRETRSQDTWENAEESAGILAAAGVRSVFLVTHAWHMRRAVIAFARFHTTVTAAPVRLDAASRFRLGDFVPNVGGWMDSYFALHEWIGCAYYTLRS